jgi:hypothetical protein
VERKHATFWWAVGVFLASALFVAWCAASRFGLGNMDEGIYLDGGLRIARGEIPYRDFFAYLAPGTFVLLGVLFKALGVSLAVSRAPVVIDLALMTALVFVLVARLAGIRPATLLALWFLAFQTVNPIILIANHRWDSAACALAGVTFGFFLLEKPCHRFALAAGACATLATWTTWSFGLLCAVILVWLFCDRHVRRYAKTWIVGSAVVSAVAVGWLWSNRALLPMVQGVLWSLRNYSGPNRTPYAFVVLGYSGPFRTATVAERALLVPFLAAVTLPATMPLLCLVAWPFRLRSHPERRVLFLLLCGAAMLASCWPRPDLNHLLYVAALPYVLGCVFLARTIGRNLRLALTTSLLLIALCDVTYTISRRLHEPSLATRVGVIHGQARDLAILRAIQSQVTPDRTLFVFPYYPAFYFTTGARNPTRYSYLQPGMFPKEDEEEVLRTLETHPADTVIYQEIQPAAYLQLWPSSDPARLRMTGIEDFLHNRYRVVAREGKFQVLRPVQQ